LYTKPMNLRLRPELEKMIEEDVQRGPYQSVDEFVERAVALLHEQEQWLASNRSEIAAKIEKGYAAAERGELLEPEAVREQLEVRKKAWVDEHRKR